MLKHKYKNAFTKAKNAHMSTHSKMHKYTTVHLYKCIITYAYAQPHINTYLYVYKQSYVYAHQLMDMYRHIFTNTCTYRHCTWKQINAWHSQAQVYILNKRTITHTQAHTKYWTCTNDIQMHTWRQRHTILCTHIYVIIHKGMHIFRQALKCTFLHSEYCVNLSYTKFSQGVQEANTSTGLWPSAFLMF